MRAIIFLPLLLLAACDVDTKDPSEAGNQVSLNADANGQVAFNFPFARGEIKLPAGMMSSSEFDIDGVRLMEGGTITGFRVNGGDGPSRVDLTFTAPVLPNEAAAYFTREFAAKGVSATAAGNSVSATSRDGTAFVMRFAPNGSGTTGTVELRPDEGRGGR